jgi:hypothetical protein
MFMDQEDELLEIGVESDFDICPNTAVRWRRSFCTLQSRVSDGGSKEML